MIDRYGIPPELIPDFIGLKGDTSRQHPRRPRASATRPPPQLLQRVRHARGVLEHVDEISGAKRKREPDRPRRGRAHLEAARDRSCATSPVDVDLDRVRRAPSPTARACARSSASSSCATRCGGSRRRSAAADAAARAPRRGRRPTELLRVARCGRWPPSTDARNGSATEVALAVAGARARPEDELFAARARPGASAPTPAASRGARGRTCRRARRRWSRGARASARRVAHDAKALRRRSRRRLAHDTMVAAYLLDPARRAYPLDELRRGARARRGGRGRRRRADARARCTRSPQRQRDADRGARADRAAATTSSCRSCDVLREMERTGVKLDTERLARDLARASTSEAASSSARSGSSRGEEFTIGSPQQLARDPVRASSACRRKRRGKTGYSTDARVLQAIRHEHEIIPKIERWRELTKLEVDLPRRAAAADRDDDGRLHTTFNQTAADDRPAVSNEPEPAEHPDPHRARPRDPRLLRRRARQRLLAIDYSQVELRMLAAHRRRGGAEGDLPPRRGRPHRDGRRRSSRAAGPGRRRHRARRRRWSTSGSSTACRRSASPTGSTSRRRRRRSSSTATSSASRRSRSSSQETIEHATEDGYVTTLFGRTPADPRAARAPVPDRASSASGSPSTRSSRGRRRTSSRSRWCAPTPRCATPGWRRDWCCRSTTSCCSRARPTRPSGPGDRRAGDGRRVRARPAARRSTSASGENWLEAK